LYEWCNRQRLENKNNDNYPDKYVCLFNHDEWITPADTRLALMQRLVDYEAGFRLVKNNFKIFKKRHYSIVIFKIL
jgi:hypothetical protein